MNTHRWLQKTSLAIALALGAATAQAGAPMVKTSAPGYYRMMLGDFEITALSDGTVDLPVDKLLTNTQPGKVTTALNQSFLKAPVETSVNAYLINTGNQLVLVDTGAAGLGPTLGKLLGNLKAAGYQPDQVDAVIVTHMHPDHVGGLLAGDRRAFPTPPCTPTSTMPTSGSARPRWKKHRPTPKASSRAPWLRSTPTSAPASSNPSTATPNSCPASRPRPRAATHRATAPTWWKARARSWCCGAT